MDLGIIGTRSAALYHPWQESPENIVIGFQRLYLSVETLLMIDRSNISITSFFASVPGLVPKKILYYRNLVSGFVDATCIFFFQCNLSKGKSCGSCQSIIKMERSTCQLLTGGLHSGGLIGSPVSYPSWYVKFGSHPFLRVYRATISKLMNWKTRSALLEYGPGAGLYVCNEPRFKS